MADADFYERKKRIHQEAARRLGELREKFVEHSDHLRAKADLASKARKTDVAASYREQSAQARAKFKEESARVSKDISEGLQRLLSSVGRKAKRL